MPLVFDARLMCRDAVGAPRPGVTRNKPKKQKKDLVWNEMIQLQAAQGAVESRPNTLNLTVKKGKKITGVAFKNSAATEPGIDLSDLVPDVPVPMSAVLKVQDKKKRDAELRAAEIAAEEELMGGAGAPAVDLLEQAAGGGA